MIELAGVPRRPTQDDPCALLVRRVYELLERRDMTAAALAKRTGMARATLARWHTAGRGNPTLRTLARLARALGVRACDLIAPR